MKTNVNKESKLSSSALPCNLVKWPLPVPVTTGRHGERKKEKNKERRHNNVTRSKVVYQKRDIPECIYGCYVHSAILPTFHRRCYWLLQTAETVEAIVSQLMEKQRLARTGGSVGAVPVAVNGHVSNAPQRQQQQQQQQLQTGGGGGGGGGRVGNSRTSANMEPQVHHNHKVGADASSLNDLATGHSLPHSLRRLSNGGPASSFIRLEPRPAPSHSSNIQQRQTATPADNAGRTAPSARAEAANFGLGRGGSTPTSMPSSSSLSSTSVPSFHTEQIHHHPETVQCQQQDHQLQHQQQQQQMISAKQESLDSNYYYSSNNCNNAGQQQQQQPAHPTPPTPAPVPSINQTTMNFMDHGSGDQGNTFPSFYSLVNANNATRRADEMLSGHGYRLPMDCLFNETLDLSQDDIQRTLSANLSHETAFHCSGGGGGSASNDGGASCSDGGLGRSIRSVETTAEDDLLVNLDAFDMLTEFSDLDCHDTIDSLISIQTGTAGGGRASGSPSDGSDGKDMNAINDRIHQLKDVPSPSTLSTSGDSMLTSITDFSPEWAPTEGGTKLLITGSFCSPTLSGSYSAVFDGIAVPAVWVQLGVLRCFCPHHSPGRVQMHVARQGIAITQPAIFEYRQVSAVSSSCHPEGSSSTAQWTNSLLTLLVGRLESLGAHLNVQGCGIDQLFSSLRAYLESGEVELQSAEEQLVSICRQLVTKRWRLNAQQPGEDASSSHTNGTRQQMNLLHLAAALGLLRVLCTLLNWRLENSSPALEQEMSPLASDQQGYTPLMWACAQGHRDVVALLAQWDPSALNVHDRSGRSAWDVARQRGHHSLAEELETRRILSVRRSTAEPSLPPPSLVQLNKSNCSSKPIESVAARQMLLAKRSSVDSVPNNNNNNEPAGNNHQAFWRRPNAAKAHKLSRDDRSYSLPLGGAGQAYSSGRNSTGSNVSCLAHDPSPSPHTMDSSNPCGPRSAAGSGVRRESVNSIDLHQQHLSPLTSIEQNTRVLTLAEQIIAAIPDRIKNETEDMVVGWSPCMELEISSVVSEVQSIEGSIDLAIVADAPPSLDGNDLTFEFSDQQYRYCETATPSSSLSPASSSCLQSPCSFSVNSPSPPPTTADFSEFLQASASLFVRDFSNLTLSDHEQRELYEAAKTIQKAYRSYVGRKRAEEQEKERAAAVIIQNYYRRYKQYVYLKQMTKAAVVIQNQFRSYYEHKRFKKNMESPSTSSASNAANSGGIASSAAAVAAAYRNYRESSLTANSARQSREGTPTSSALKRTYSQRRQHQAARKIQQFMRQSKNKLQRERALRRAAESHPEMPVELQQQHRAPAAVIAPAIQAPVADPSQVP
ncbi:putative Calmodulin-binding transcription activator 1 [Daphnia magna]|uniref:Putative Calmodulin-binding transcription activator 1 n=1 Tax=Daphnia magna TaxID=35525 RepID=A0A164WPC1_9CRUS|nr:putative Calmodulin-binding transcription activator 1 [Daphnia magna]